MNYAEASRKYRCDWKNEKSQLEIKQNRLVSAEGKYMLISPAADAWKRMKKAAANDGINIWLTSAYRSPDYQAELVKARMASGKAAPDICEYKGEKLRTNDNLMACPGSSNHGWGRAIDIQPVFSNSSSSAFTWLKNNALNFGFVNYTAEPWHWEYEGEPPCCGCNNNPAIGFGFSSITESLKAIPQAVKFFLGGSIIGFAGVYGYMKFTK